MAGFCTPAAAAMWRQQSVVGHLVHGEHRAPCLSFSVLAQLPTAVTDGKKKYAGDETWQLDLATVSMILASKSRRIRNALSFERSFRQLNLDLARLVVDQPPGRRPQAVQRIMSHLEDWVREQTAASASENYLATARHRLSNPEAYIEECRQSDSGQPGNAAN